MHCKPGDHICALYSTTAELADAVGRFIADGLRNGDRCWYIATGNETSAIRTVLRRLKVDVGAETARGALKLISASDAYMVHGTFEPEATLQVFNDGIEQAYTDGFTGFRAAAEMSWALDHEEATQQIIVYAALLRSLFSNCRAIGLCLYDRHRMPLNVIDGALATHPILRGDGDYLTNPLYDPEVSGV